MFERFQQTTPERGPDEDDADPSGKGDDHEREQQGADEEFIEGGEGVYVPEKVVEALHVDEEDDEEKEEEIACDQQTIERVASRTDEATNALPGDEQACDVAVKAGALGGVAAAEPLLGDVERVGGGYVCRAWQLRPGVNRKTQAKGLEESP